MVDWDNYYEQTSTYANYLPFMTVPGNHERDCAHPWPTQCKEIMHAIFDVVAYGNCPR